MVWQSAFSSNRYGAVDFMAEFLIKTKRRKKKKQKKTKRSLLPLNCSYFGAVLQNQWYMCVCVHTYTHVTKMKPTVHFSKIDF